LENASLYQSILKVRIIFFNIFTLIVILLSRQVSTRQAEQFVTFPVILLTIALL